ncbi:hypothetical protein GCM10023149_27230 [Mucilaginibacter gynuensis]|uniref:Uncharacterized protein n=1 Tax=Mucilaginibacter gynuensis TaxID=1302236 RepID=A0ABP8GJB0_9SPHI
MKPITIALLTLLFLSGCTAFSRHTSSYQLGMTDAEFIVKNPTARVVERSVDCTVYRLDIYLNEGLVHKYLYFTNSKLIKIHNGPTEPYAQPSNR